MRVLMLILCLVGLVGCEQRTVDASVSQERHGLVYVPNETEPYTGNITKSYPSGQLEYEAALVDGKQNGLTREWHENGQLESEATYVDGEKMVWAAIGARLASCCLKSLMLMADRMA